jgi:hypothetical protein
LRQAERLEELLEQHLSRMRWLSVCWSADHRSPQW